MDLNVSLDGGARSRKGESTGAASIPGSNGEQQTQNLQQQRKRKPNRDSWPFMHAIMLLECFKDVWTKSNMGNLTMAQWTEVSNKVNEFCGISMNEQQCRTKVDNLKKRYKRERMKYAPTGHTSPWEFYGVMNKLFGNTTKLTTTGASSVPGQPTVGDGCGEDTEGSDEEDVVVLDNGGDLIFNIPGVRDMGGLSSSSPQAPSFGRGQSLPLEGAGDDTSPNENPHVADGSNYQDAGFPSACGLSPVLNPAKRMARGSKRKRDAAEGYGDLIKEAEQRRLLEVAKLDRKRARLLSCYQDCRTRPESEESDGVAKLERRRENSRLSALYEAEHKVEQASKQLAEAQEQRERLEREAQVLRETSEYRKTLAAALKPSFNKAFLDKLTPPDAINVSLDKFPYYLSDVTRDFLVEAVVSCLNQSRRPSTITGLCASSNTILLNGPQYSEVYQETLVKAIACDQGASLLTLDSIELAPQDHGCAEEEVEDADSLKMTEASKPALRKGDRVVSRGSRRGERLRRGRVVAVSEAVAGRVGVAFDDETRGDTSRDGVPIEWHYASDFEKEDLENSLFLAEWQASFSALSEICGSAKPLIVYFPDVESWFQRAVPVCRKLEMLETLQKQLDKLKGTVAFIASFISGEDEPASMVSRRRLRNAYSLFTHVVDVFPPKDDHELWRWKMLLSQDSERIIANKNIQRLQKVVLSHNVIFSEFMNFQICEFLLTQSEAECVIGWAVNYEYANPDIDRTSSKVVISAGSLHRALLKLRRLKHAHGFKVSSKDEYEEAVLSIVVPPNGGPKFEDVGALDDLKKILGELVVLPLLRPEHFNRGSLACSCKGVLLYGPPGTGKTLLTKAVANQSSANLFWLKGSSIDYKWLQDPKNMTRALFTVARRLAPSIIFLDEIDSIFCLQAGEAMNRFKFEFLYGWDRFMPRAGESVVVMAATYRPFDLDEPIIQKFPRRLWIDLPDAQSREKILHILLAKEETESNFHFKGVAEATVGFSGNDLKNLTAAAAYRPVREMLELEKARGSAFVQESVTLRPLTIEDFVSALEEVNVSDNAGYVEQLRQWDGRTMETGVIQKERPF